LVAAAVQFRHLLAVKADKILRRGLEAIAAGAVRGG